MRLTTIRCQLTDTFAGFLSTVRYLPAVALVSYLFDRSHSWYAAFLKIFVLVQGTGFPKETAPHKSYAMTGVPMRCTPSLRAAVFNMVDLPRKPGDRGSFGGDFFAMLVNRSQLWFTRTSIAE